MLGAFLWKMLQLVRLGWKEFDLCGAADLGIVGLEWTL